MQFDASQQMYPCETTNMIEMLYFAIKIRWISIPLTIPPSTSLTHFIPLYWDIIDK